MGEQELAKTGVSGTILRFSFVLAEEGGVLNDFERAANFGPFLIIPGSGQAQLQPILREDAARCVVETIDKPELNGRIVELGGPEVVTYEAMFDWFIQARGIKKPKLKLPVGAPHPGRDRHGGDAHRIRSLTPDEINTIQLDNIADGIDSVSAHYGWRPTRPELMGPGELEETPRALKVRAFFGLPVPEPQREELATLSSRPCAQLAPDFSLDAG